MANKSVLCALKKHHEDNEEAHLKQEHGIQSPVEFVVPKYRMKRKSIESLDLSGYISVINCFYVPVQRVKIDFTFENL